MVAIKAAQANAFVRSPPADCLAVLVYGTDVGLASERTAQIAKAFAEREQPAGEIIRIEDPDLEQDPDRLSVELQTMPMFGGSKVVRTTIGRRVTGAVLKGIIDDGAPAAQLVVEAGNLRPSDAARKAFEATSWAAAVPCYADSERDLAGLVKEMVAAAGLTIEQDAQELLLERLGADRALSRGEVEKLILYVGDGGAISADHVKAIVGDASEMAMDAIAQAAAGGAADSAVRELDRAIAAGSNAQVLIGAVQRYFRRLHRLRAAIDAGKSFDDAARGLRPPIFFKQKDDIAAQCRLWNSARLMTAMGRIGEVAKAARLNSAIETILAERLLLELATMAKASRRG